MPQQTYADPNGRQVTVSFPDGAPPPDENALHALFAQKYGNAYSPTPSNIHKGQPVQPASTGPSFLDKTADFLSRAPYNINAANEAFTNAAASGISDPFGIVSREQAEVGRPVIAPESLGPAIGSTGFSNPPANRSTFGLNSDPVRDLFASTLQPGQLVGAGVLALTGHKGSAMDALTAPSPLNPFAYTDQGQFGETGGGEQLGRASSQAAIPSTVGYAGMKAGGAIGKGLALGALGFFGPEAEPLAPVVGGAGEFIGSLAGGATTGWLANEAQDRLMHATFGPDVYNTARQEFAKGQQQYPVQTAVGELLPNAAFFDPDLANISKVTANRLGGAAIGAAQEGFNQIQQGRFDPLKLGLQAAGGYVLGGHETPAGEAVARPIDAVTSWATKPFDGMPQNVRNWVAKSFLHPDGSINTDSPIMTQPDPVVAKYFGGVKDFDTLKDAIGNAFTPLSADPATHADMLDTAAKYIERRARGTAAQSGMPVEEWYKQNIPGLIRGTMVEAQGFADAFNNNPDNFKGITDPKAIQDAQRKPELFAAAAVQPNRVAIDPATGEATILPQGAPLPEGKMQPETAMRVIMALNKPDVSDIPHEFEHIWLDSVRSDPALSQDAAVIDDYLGAKPGEPLTEAQQEKWAQTVSRIPISSDAPAKGISPIVDKMRDWMSDIYQTIAGSKQADKIAGRVPQAVIDVLAKHTGDISDLGGGKAEARGVQTPEGGNARPIPLNPGAVRAGGDTGGGGGTADVEANANVPQSTEVHMLVDGRLQSRKLPPEAVARWNDQLARYRAQKTEIAKMPDTAERSVANAQADAAHNGAQRQIAGIPSESDVKAQQKVDATGQKAAGKAQKKAEDDYQRQLAVHQAKEEGYAKQEATRAQTAAQVHQQRINGFGARAKVTPAQLDAFNRAHETFVTKEQGRQESARIRAEQRQAVFEARTGRKIGESPAAPTPEPATVSHETPKAQGTGLPEYVQDEIDRRFAESQKLGITQEISDLAAQRLTRKQIASRISADHGITPSDANDIVNGVRAKLGIPSMDDSAEFEKWLNARGKSSTPQYEIESEKTAEKYVADRSVPIPEAARRVLATYGHGDNFELRPQLEQYIKGARDRMDRGVSDTEVKNQFGKIEEELLAHNKETGDVRVRSRFDEQSTIAPQDAMARQLNYYPHLDPSKFEAQPPTDPANPHLWQQDPVKIGLDDWRSKQPKEYQDALRLARDLKLYPKAGEFKAQHPEFASRAAAERSARQTLTEKFPQPDNQALVDRANELQPHKDAVMSAIEKGYAVPPKAAREYPEARRALQREYDLNYKTGTSNDPDTIRMNGRAGDPFFHGEPLDSNGVNRNLEENGIPLAVMPKQIEGARTLVERAGDDAGPRPENALFSYRGDRPNGDKTADDDTQDNPALDRFRNGPDRTPSAGDDKPAVRGTTFNSADHALFSYRGNRPTGTPGATPVTSAGREKATALDNARTIYTAGLVSGPATLGKVITSNLAHGALREGVERPAAALADIARTVAARAAGGESTPIGRVLGTDRAVQGIDPVAFGRSTAAAAKKGVEVAKNTVEFVKSGGTITHEDGDASGLGSRVLALTSKNPLLDYFAKATNFYVNGTLGSHGNVNAVSREFAMVSSINEQANLIAQAEARATKGVDVKARATELRENPTPEMQFRAIQDAAIATFTSKNIFSDAIGSGKRTLGKNAVAGTLANIAVPISKIPVNIASEVLQRTPLGLAYNLGDAAAKVRQSLKIDAAHQSAQATYQQNPNFSNQTAMRVAAMELASKGFNGTARAQLARAIAKGASGTALMMIGAKLANNGLLTGANIGQNDYKKRLDAGIPPNSVLIGGKWREIDTQSPVGTMLTLGATLREQVAKSQDDNESPGAAYAKAGTGALMNAAGTAPLLSEGAFHDLSEADPTKFFGGMIGSAIPAVVGAGATAIDNGQQRSTKGLILGPAMAKIPWLREQLPAANTEPLGPLSVFDPFHSKPSDGSLSDPDMFAPRGRGGRGNGLSLPSLRFPSLPR